MRRGGAAALVAAALAAVAVVAWPVAQPASAAGSPIGMLQSGYWWEPETAGSPLPAPPQVPPGGLWVSSDASGPQSISALRFTLGAGASSPVVSLRVSHAAPASQVAILACPAVSPWTPPNGAGVWAARPHADCSKGKVAGQLNAAATVMTFNLATLAEGPTVDVVLEPPPLGQGVGSVSPTFDATFDRISAGEISTTAPPAPAPAPISSPSGPSFAAVGPTPGPAAVGGVPPSVAGPPTGAAVPAAAGSPVVPATPAALAARAPALAGLAPSSSAGPATSPSPVQLASPGRFLVSHTRSWRDRVLLSLALVDLIAYGVFDAERRRKRGRPPLSLYDTPSAALMAVAALVRSRAGRRPGSPPSLR